MDKCKSTPSKIFDWPKKNFGQKIPTPDLDKCKSTPPPKFLAGPKKNFSQKIPTPDLDKCKSTPPPPKFLASQKNTISAKKFRHQIWTKYPPPTEVTPDLDTTHPGGQFCQRNLPCVFIRSGSKMAAKGSEGPKLNKMPTLGLGGSCSIQDFCTKFGTGKLGQNVKLQ